MTLKPTESGIAIRRLTTAGIAITAVFLGGFCVWAATAQLSGAVIAPGIVVVESSVKKVAHSTGGVVKEILVREGSVVSAGQVVVRLDDTVLRASLGVVRAQLDQATARLARLTAERDELREISFPAGLHERGSEEAVATSIIGERHLFESRRQLQDGQRLQLHERVAQNEDEVRALEAQLEAKRQELKLTNDELAGVSELFQKQLAGITRFSQLKRDKARLEGEAGQLAAQIAQAHGKISEIKLQIIQLDQNFRTDLLNDLRDAQGKIAELTERLVGAQDQLQRVDIRAPLDGIVYELAVHAKDAVVSPGETIMGIVPSADRLIVDAHFAPSDIDQIAVGSSVAVRVSAGNRRTTPEFAGRITQVSPDLSHDAQTNAAYFSVRVALADAPGQHSDGLKLMPGMQAEVFAATDERTPFEYLLKPLTEQILRTFRER